ncbi:MAG: hypothetical protein KC645_18680 [Gemmatimonadetes bacterium]|nr:hypothetical protein [Gemmatimonadota bacterium]
MRGLPTRPGPEAVDNALAGLDDSRWNRGLIRPPWAREWLGAGVGLVILGGMGLGAWTAAWKGIEAGDAPWIAGAALWGVGCASFLLQVSILGTRWLRFRGVALRLDPFPASPGGPLGGSVEIPQSPSDARSCRVRITCTRVETAGDSTRHHVLWAAEGHPRVERWRTGRQRLSFTFALPPDLPCSRVRGKDGCDWHVGLYVPGRGPDLDVVFLVPVLPSETPRAAQEAVRVEPLGTDAHPHPKVRVRELAGAVHIELLPGRNLRVGAAAGVFGLVFAGVGALLGAAALGAFGNNPFAALLGGLTGFVALVFVLLGLLVFGVGLATSFGSGTLIVHPDHLVQGRRARRLPTAELDAIEATPDAQMGQGASATLSYRFTAVPTAGRPTVLLQGVPGPGPSQILARRIEAITGVPTRFVARKAAGVAPSAAPSPSD